MGRPRKPTQFLEMVGAFDKNPARRRARAGEPTAAPLTDSDGPPAYFTEEERKAWSDVRRACAPGVLMQSDCILLEVSARLLAQFRTDPTIPTTRISLLSQCLARMGLSPADRSRVTVPPGARPENRFANNGRRPKR